MPEAKTTVRGICRASREKILAAAALGLLVLLALACLVLLWRGARDVVVRIEPAVAGTPATTNVTFHGFAAVNVPLVSVLHALNTTPFAILDEGLFPMERVNVCVSWKGWRRTWHAYPESDPVLKRLVEACEDRYGFRLSMLKIATNTCAMVRLPGVPFGLEAFTSNRYAGFLSAKELNMPMDMAGLAKQVSWKMKGVPVNDETGIKGTYMVHIRFATEDPRQVDVELEKVGLMLAWRQAEQTFLVHQPVEIDPGGNVLALAQPVPGVTIRRVHVSRAAVNGNWHNSGALASGAAMTPLGFLSIFPEGQRPFVDHAGLSNGTYSIQVDQRGILRRDQIRNLGQSPLWVQVIRAYEAYFRVVIHEERQRVDVWRLECPDPALLKLKRADKQGAGLHRGNFECQYSGTTMDQLCLDLARSCPDRLRLLRNATELSNFWAFSLKIVPDDPDTTARNLEALGLRLARRQEDVWTWVIDPVK